MSVDEARERILVVDDDEQNLRLLRRVLERAGYRCTCVVNAPGAREALAGAAFELLVCDVKLPGESGLELVASALDADASLAALMVSGLDSVDVAERAIEAGASGYIVKPFTANGVVMGVLAALSHRRRELDAAEELNASREETIERLCMAVEARDNETALHITEMSEYCWRIARRLGLGAERAALIRRASTMHDVGKIAVADSILLKPGLLDAGECAEMQRHAEIGYRILAGSRSELLQMAATIAWTHHERFDGSGYPRGLRGDEIAIEGRIAAAADVFDALTRDRVYRPRMPRTAALEEIERGRGTHFDPDIADALLAIGRKRPRRRRSGGQPAEQRSARM